MDRMTIGAVARETGLRTSAIRYYESVGLIPEPRREGGQRRYGPEVLTHLAIVRMAQEAGFTIEEIRTLVSGFPTETPAGERWRELAQRKLPEVEGLIARLQAVRRVLEESMHCGCLTLDACAAIGWGRGDEAEPARCCSAGLSGPMGVSAGSGARPACRASAAVDMRWR